MVSRIDEVEEYVKNAIAASENKQSTEMARRLSDHKGEIERDFEQKSLGMTQSQREFSTSAGTELEGRLKK